MCKGNKKRSEIAYLCRMKIKLLCMGAVRDEAIATAISLYAKRIPFYWPFSMVCLPDVKTSKTAGTDKQKELEGERFLDRKSVV